MKVLLFKSSTLVLYVCTVRTEFQIILTFASLLSLLSLLSFLSFLSLLRLLSLYDIFQIIQCLGYPHGLQVRGGVELQSTLSYSILPYPGYH